MALCGKLPIKDMFLDLRDGRKLLDLLEGLTGTPLLKERGSTRVHALNNVNKVLQVLHQNNVELVNIGGTDIVDGNHKLTLGLLWSIILHWQVKDVMKDIMSELQQTNSEKILLSWVRQCTRPYTEVNVLNFTTSWTDGLAFSAVIHRHKPELFGWNKVTKMTPVERLEHAFNIAKNYLGIEKLLDPEDVAVQLPDKKSIIMYLTSLFEVLPQKVTMEDIKEVETLPRKYKKECEEGDVQSATSEDDYGGSRAETPSTVTEVDMDLESYQVALEEVLTWLLSAEDTFQEQEEISNDVEEVKGQFATHEAFMMELTAHQSSVGNVLQAGNQLIAQGNLSVEEESEIQEQMTLLNSRWETLRVDSMDRQSHLHDVLMELQKKQLQQLSDWLTATEGRIQKMESQFLAEDLESLQKKMDEHKGLQNDLETEQVKVNSLTHMVVIVDENNGENATAILEEQLQRLGERWTAVCRWTEERWTKLQQINILWQELLEEQCLLKAWLTEKEEALNKVQTSNFKDQKELGVNVRKLAILKEDMGMKRQTLEQLNEVAHDVAQLLNNEQVLKKIDSDLDELTQRWDRLVQKLEDYSNQVTQAVVNVGMPQVSQKFITETFLVKEQKKVKHSTEEESSLPVPLAKKRQPCLDTEVKKKLDSEIAELLNWVLKSRAAIQAIEIKQYKKKRETSDMKDKLKVIEKERSEKKRMLNELEQAGQNMLDQMGKDIVVTSQGPGSPDESHISFGELMSRLVQSLEIDAIQQPGPSTDKFYDVVCGELSTSIVLQLITTLWQAMIQPWDLPAHPQPTSRRYEAMYRVREEDILFLLRHPKLNSVVVESSQGRESRGHTMPRDKEGRKIDSIASRVYAASGLGMRILNYEARYQYFIMQHLNNVIVTLPGNQCDLAKVFIKEAMQVAVQQLSTAHHHVDTDSGALVDDHFHRSLSRFHDGKSIRPAGQTTSYCPTYPSNATRQDYSCQVHLETFGPYGCVSRHCPTCQDPTSSFTAFPQQSVPTAKRLADETTLDPIFCSPLSTMVDSPSQSKRGGTFSTPMPFDDSRYRCIPFGMGSSMFRPTHPRRMESTGIQESHQFPRTSGSFQGSVLVRGCSSGPSISDNLGQHRYSLLSEQTRRDEVTNVSTAFDENLGVVHFEIYYPDSSTPSGYGNVEADLLSRHMSTSHEWELDRQSGNQTRVNRGCLYDPLEQYELLRFPSDSPHHESDIEDSPVALSWIISNSMVAVPSLVLDSSADLPRRIPPPSIHPIPHIPVTGHDSPLGLNIVEVDCMVNSITAHTTLVPMSSIPTMDPVLGSNMPLHASNPLTLSTPPDLTNVPSGPTSFHPDIQHILDSALRPSTLKPYVAKWRRFSVFAESHSFLPQSASIDLQFLLQLYHSGLKPSSIKVYTAAISHYRGTIQGFSIFSQPLIKRFLRGLHNLYPTEGLPTEDLANALEKLAAEWKGTVLHLEEAARKIQCQDELNIYFRQVDELDRTLCEKELWLKENSASSPQHQCLAALKESCQMELTHLLSLTPQIEHLKDKCKALELRSVSPNFIEDSLISVTDSFRSSQQKLEVFLQQLKKAESENQPSKDYVDALKKLKDELNELESKVQSSMNTVNDLSKVERALQQTKTAYETLENQKSMIDKLAVDTQVLEKHIPDEKAKLYKQEFKCLQGYREKLKLKISKDVHLLEEIMSKLSLFEADLKLVQRWLDGVKDFLMKEQTIQRDPEVLQSQLDQCMLFVHEMEKIELSLKEMKEIDSALRGQPINVWVKSKLTDVQSQWEKLSKQIISHKNQLSESQEKAVNLKKDLAEMQEWMSQAEEEYLERDFEYKSPDELENAVEEMKRAKEDVLQKEVRVKIMKDNIKMLAAKLPSGGQDLTTELNLVLENYQLLCNRIRGKCHTLEEVWSCWIELLHYLDLETTWLNTLEERIKSSENLPDRADAVNEALESLEYVLRHPTDNRTQIRELGQTLIDGGILDEIISEKLEIFNARYEELSHVAVSRQISLEQQLQTMRDTERMLQVLQENLKDLDRQLTSYLTDRIDAFQMPQEAQKIQAEIAAHESTLEELKKNARLVMPASPECRSPRGGTHLDTLQRKLREVSTKYQLFQKPANFEQRMLDCKRVLDSVKAELHVLDAKDIDPDVIQSHFDKCMKLYKTLSEVKLEVETVIKTGRQIVQKQQTDNPKTMDEQLTALKFLYNDLGAQVTEGKQDLEQALQLSCKLKEVSLCLSKWLEATEAELVHKSTTESLLTDLDTEIAWAKSVLRELERKKVDLNNITESSAVLQTLIEGSETSLEEKLCVLNAGWSRVRTWTEDWCNTLL
ncbi:Utrophin, partial [Varanus komodoensis]